MNTAYYDMLILLQQQTQALIRRNAKIRVSDENFGVEIKVLKSRRVRVISTYADEK
ncbi:MAG: hypothetical protein V7765_12595 [Oleispira sp.]